VSASSTAAIRLLTPGDLDGALSLSTGAGWNQRREDWSMLLQLARAGSFAAIDDGRIVGTAIGIDYGGFGWIAMMLVEPAFRGHGLGARLLEAAMGALPPDLPIRLDATPLGRPLYRRYGFADEYLLTRHVAEAADRRDHAGSLAPSPGVRQMTAADLTVVAGQDPQIFGGNRQSVLSWAREHALGYARVAPAGASLLQYCLGRQGRLFDQIGPVVARDHDVARALVGAALREAGDRAVVVDAIDSRKTFGSWLAACGFRPQRPLFRMCRGRQRSDQAGTRPELVEFAIFGPEFA
jgi:GNAT superfamily N-acetyltransferase